MHQLMSPFFLESLTHIAGNQQSPHLRKFNLQIYFPVWFRVSYLLVMVFKASCNIVAYWLQQVGHGSRLVRISGVW